ncbi:MAG: hypothetical protein ACYTFI_16905, partial [Planctomycetota bacterium]
FGSLQNGTFAGQLFQVRNTFTNEDGKVKFSYGLGKAPLYNVGYPLQRIMEGPTSELIKGEFGEASEMILRTRKRTGVALEHSPSDAPELPRSDDAENVFFANAAAAKAFGLADLTGGGSGVVKARPVGSAPGDGAWANRFVLDGLPSGHEKLLVLTQPSGARKLHEAHRAKAADGIFLALAVHTGILVAASAPAAGVSELALQAAELPLTWRLGA